MSFRPVATFILLCAAALNAAEQVSSADFGPEGTTKLWSPITSRPFYASVTPLNQADTTLSDMGADDDGCRHSSNRVEYARYVVTDPTSYFSALSVEWDDKSGRFVQPLTPEFKQWVDRTFNGDLATDIQRAFTNRQKLRAAQNQPPLDRDKFVMDQDAVPVEKRFEYALRCYEKRGARAAVLAKLALTGAWSTRARFQLPISDPRLAGAFEEVNDKVVRQIKDGEQFNLGKWYGIYRDIFAKSDLKPSAYLVAGQVAFGFATRIGDRKQAEEIIEKLTERFKPNRENNDGHEFQRGIVRTMKRQHADYIQLLDRASREFRRAIAEEEFTRIRLPEVVLAVAESLRRSGNTTDAVDWYLCLAQMGETQPKLRADIRAEGKAPGPSAPYHVQLGWIADRQLDALAAAGVAHAGVASGANKGLINAILFDGLGTLEYVNPGWQPRTGAEAEDCAFVLDLVGKGVLVHQQRYAAWPEKLGDLWIKDIHHDRNRVNRFHCPVTGAPFAYKQLTGDQAAKTIVVATREPVPTKDGKRFIGYLANNTVIWSDKPLAPGELWLK